MSPLPWAERLATIEEALRRIPTPKQKITGAIPSAHLVPDIARMLANPGNEVRARQAASAPSTRKKLLDIRKHSAKLLAALDGAPQAALDAIPFKAPWPEGAGGLSWWLRMLIAACDHAHVPDTLPKSGGRGGKKKDREARLTDAVAFHYENLTGRKPTFSRVTGGGARGDFLVLLKHVLAANGIDASPESQTRGWGAREKNRVKIGD